MAEDRRRRLAGVALLLGLGAGALGLLVALVLGSGPRPGGTGPPGSSYATVPEGAKASYLLLASLGHRVERRAEPIGNLRATNLAFLLAPSSRLDRVDLVGLGDWIEAGGTLVYGVAAFEPAAEVLHEALGLARLEVRPIGRGLATLDQRWEPARRLVVRVSASLPGGRGTLARDGGESRALMVERGRGRIYVVDAEVFSNAGLREGDNALFLAVLAARHDAGRPIVFDEFVHGYGDAVSLLAVAAWPLRLAVATGILALLAYALAAGRRLGPPSPEPAPPRRASTEQIDALATFYAARLGRSDALESIAAWAGTSAPPAARQDAAFVTQARTLIDGVTRRPTVSGI